MMRCSRLVALGLFIATGVQSDSIVYRHPWTGLSFPFRLAALSFQNVRDFEKSGAGCCLRYHSEDNMVADIFLYTDDVEDIGGRRRAWIVSNQFQKIQQMLGEMEEMELHHKIKLETVTNMVVGSTSGASLFHRADYEIQSEHLPISPEFSKAASTVLLSSYAHSFIKIRFTCLLENKTRGRQALDEFVRQVGCEVMHCETHHHEDLDYIVELAEKIPHVPVNQTWRRSLMWAHHFLEHSTSINVMLDLDVIEPLMNSTYKYDYLLLTHFMLLCGAYDIKYHGKRDRVALDVYALGNNIELYSKLRIMEPKEIFDYYELLCNMEPPLLKTFVITQTGLPTKKDASL